VACLPFTGWVSTCSLRRTQLHVVFYLATIYIQIQALMEIDNSIYFCFILTNTKLIETSHIKTSGRAQLRFCFLITTQWWRGECSQSFSQSVSQTMLWAGQPGLKSQLGRIFSSPQCTDWLWRPPILLSNGYWWPFFVTYLLLVGGAIPPFPHMYAQCGASLRTGDNFTSTFYAMMKLNQNHWTHCTVLWEG
jgi:hypothetical protein